MAKDECCGNCSEWAGRGFNLVFAWCDTLKEDTDAGDWCAEYRKESEQSPQKPLRF